MNLTCTQNNYYNWHIEGWRLYQLYIKFSSYLTDNTLNFCLED